MIIVSGIFYGYYWFSLRDKKFHHYNRFYLLAVSLLSLIIPCLQLNWFTIKQTDIITSNALLGYVMSNKDAIVESKSLLTLSSITIILLIFGGVFLLSRLCFNLYKIYRLKQNAEVVTMDGFDFINTAEEEAPFSFLNNLFWKNTISLEVQSGQHIFKHELTHIQEKHTWDRLYCQVVACLFWMNPFNWLIQKELETIHEFIADEAAVGNNNTEAFAQMLLETHYGHHFLNPTHSFFYASIKRRLANLTTVENSKFNYLRKLMGMPLLLLVLVVFAIKVNAEERMINELNKIDEVVVMNVITNNRFDSIPKEKVLKKKLSRKKLIKKLEATKAFTIIDQSSDIASANFNDPVMTYDKMNQLDSFKIKKMNILDKKIAIEKYGSIAKFGVVEVESSPTEKIIMIMRDPKEIKKGQLNPLYVLDGVALETFPINLEPNHIKSMSIRKDNEARKMFGKKSKNGVVFISTK
jgi:beta-lactamase regulating signal transducer with metallopeptidase domain